MAKCRKCNKTNAEYQHFDGYVVCSDCIGKYFTCPDCGRLFDWDDYAHGDQGSGFCKACNGNH